MSASLPASVDAERMVVGRRSFEGALPVAALPRLVEALADDGGEVVYRLDFERGELGGPELHVRAQAGLMLQCQRSLDNFVFPAVVDSWLGLLADEHAASALPTRCEPLLLDHGALSPWHVIEDELILVLPLVPVKPGSQILTGEWNRPTEQPQDAEQGEPVTRPFAGLRHLLETRNDKPR